MREEIDKKLKIFDKTSKTLKDQAANFTKESGKMAALSIAWMIISFIGTDSASIEENLKFLVTVLLAIFGMGFTFIFRYVNKIKTESNKKQDEILKYTMKIAEKHKEMTDNWTSCIEEKEQLKKEREDLTTLINILRIELNRAYLEMIKDNAIKSGKQKVRDKAAKSMRRAIRNAKQGL